MTIHLERGEQIATITIDRTHRRNALDLASLEDLHAAVVRCVSDGARATPNSSNKAIRPG